MMAVDIVKTRSVDKLPNDLEGMEASMERLLSLIDDVYKYVDSVVVRSQYLLNIDHVSVFILALGFKDNPLSFQQLNFG